MTVKNSLALLLISPLFLVLPAKLFADNTISIQVFSLNESGVLDLDFEFPNGTATGFFTQTQTNADGDTGSARVNIDPGIGEIALFATLTAVPNGNTTALLGGIINDTLIFDLPDGMNSANVTLEATTSGAISSGQIGNSGSDQVNLRFGNEITNENGYSYSGPETFTVTKSVVDGEEVNARIIFDNDWMQELMHPLMWGWG